MFEPGYYKTNYRALRLREMMRWYGWRRGIRAWLKTRFMPVSRSGRWMPGLWAENECNPEDLSQDFWQATKPHRADFEKLGFVQCHLAKPERSFDPTVRDSGGIFYLDPTRCYFGQLIYSRSYNQASRRESNNIVIGFTTVYEWGTLSSTNHKLAFDSVNKGKVIRLNSFDVSQIYDRFREELQRRPEAPQAFADVATLSRWSDARQIRDFEDRVRRRLFIPMTDSEVAAAKATMESGGQTPAPAAWRRFRIDVLPATMVLALLVSLILYQHWQHSGSIAANDVASNMIDYQGQQFKMSRSYTEFDDYKDDPNNLDTNELPRIEQTMESVNIPATFKDYNELVYTTVNLEFPGYGESVGGGKTDDGSKLDVVTAEIPQVDKERVVVAQNQPDGSWKLVDDFIYAGSDTNDINRVRLEHRQLEYFDKGGRLLRKKALEK